MELTTQRTAGLLGLIEFRTTEKNNIQFENDFGLIKDRKIHLGTDDLVLEIDTIQQISLITHKPHYYRGQKVSFAIILAAVLLLRWDAGLLAICLIATVSLLTFKKRSTTFVQIILDGNQERMILIHQNEINNAKAFIKEFNKYR